MTLSDASADPANSTLANARKGRWKCVAINGDPESQIRLKRLGVCEGREVTLLQHGDPLILNVVGAQVAVSWRLAQSVHVASLEQS